ncbi:(2Fe-2S) ferredoxin domain-containing protein [Halosquirtibacter xylanolyticus]|uniref:(2Fe-2S) ferredoxin domain-containing protein n=1 Tax=Halosquirtibacter xylanolyticus TaxID=3374599 RepID=UPI00374A8E70|nr:(2Fe-2S) ferredoxin domain-containing protein [Prolixibacteraceae bacterium]
MTKVKNLEELVKLRNKLKDKIQVRTITEGNDLVARIRVAMGTCGIASGAKETFEALISEVERLDLKVLITTTGCMGACYAEPTVEVTLPNQEPIIFGEVDSKRAVDIINEYIIKGKLIDGVVPQNYQSI